jgi:hypothetical protein
MFLYNHRRFNPQKGLVEPILTHVTESELTGEKNPRFKPLSTYCPYILSHEIQKTAKIKLK